MTVETWSVLVYGLLVLFTVVFQSIYNVITGALRYGLSNREGEQPNKGPLGFRIDRTLSNTIEGALMYLPFALIAIHLDISNVYTLYAAILTIISRVLYTPIYILGIEKIRTLVWTVGFISIPMMVYGIFLGIGE